MGEVFRCGHPKNDENMGWTRDARYSTGGYWRCRACRKVIVARWRARNGAAIADYERSPERRMRQTQRERRRKLNQAMEALNAG